MNLDGWSLNSRNLVTTSKLAKNTVAGGQEHRAGERDWEQGIWEEKTVLHKRF